MTGETKEQEYFGYMVQQYLDLQAGKINAIKDDQVFSANSTTLEQIRNRAARRAAELIVLGNEPDPAATIGTSTYELYKIANGTIDEHGKVKISKDAVMEWRKDANKNVMVWPTQDIDGDGKITSNDRYGYNKGTGSDFANGAPADFLRAASATDAVVRAANSLLYGQKVDERDSHYFQHEQENVKIKDIDLRNRYGDYEKNPVHVRPIALESTKRLFDLAGNLHNDLPPLLVTPFPGATANHTSVVFAPTVANTPPAAKTTPAANSPAANPHQWVMAPTGPNTPNQPVIPGLPPSLQFPTVTVANNRPATTQPATTHPATHQSTPPSNNIPGLPSYLQPPAAPATAGPNQWVTAVPGTTPVATDPWHNYEVALNKAVAQGSYRYDALIPRKFNYTGTGADAKYVDLIAHSGVVFKDRVEDVTKKYFERYAKASPAEEKAIYAELDEKYRSTDNDTKGAEYRFAKGVLYLAKYSHPLNALPAELNGAQLTKAQEQFEALVVKLGKEGASVATAKQTTPPVTVNQTTPAAKTTPPAATTPPAGATPPAGTTPPAATTPLAATTPPASNKAPLRTTTDAKPLTEGLEDEALVKFAKGEVPVAGMSSLLWRGAHSAGTADQAKAFGDLIQQLERSLDRVNGTEKGDDGVFGAGLKALVEKFQTEHNIKIDGIVGRQTITALQVAELNKVLSEKAPNEKAVLDEAKDIEALLDKQLTESTKKELTEAVKKIEDTVKPAAGSDLANTVKSIKDKAGISL